MARGGKVGRGLEAGRRSGLAATVSPRHLGQVKAAQEAILCGHLADRLEQVALGLVEAGDAVVLLLLLGVLLLEGVLLLLLHLRLLLGLLLLHHVLLLALAARLLVYLLHRAQLLLQLHPPILEPDLYLPLGQAERVGDLDSPPSRQVVVEVELLLELKGLEARVGLPTPAPRTAVRACKHREIV